MTDPETTPADLVAAFAEKYRLELRCEFVPYSVAKATRADWDEPGKPAWKGLTWTVHLVQRAKIGDSKRDVLVTPYSAGIGHCPAYKAPASAFSAAHFTEKRARQELIDWECEHGKAGRWSSMGISSSSLPGKRAALEPTLAEVLYCLSNDAGAIDHPTFESWASDYGYDTDSRKGEAAYRTCLEIGLKLRAFIGEEGLEELREALQDY